MIKEFAILPGFILGFIMLLIELIYDLDIWRYSEVSEGVTIIALFVYLIVFTILIALNRKKELTGKLKGIYHLCISILKTAVFWGIVAVISELIDELAILIVIAGYVLFNNTGTSGVKPVYIGKAASL